MYKFRLFYDLDDDILIKLVTTETSLDPDVMSMFSPNMLITSETILQYFLCRLSDTPLTWSKPLNPQ
jgi:hypothetical protein